MLPFAPIARMDKDSQKLDKHVFSHLKQKKRKEKAILFSKSC